MKKTLTGLLLVLTLLSGIVMPGVAVFAEEETPVSKSALEITPSGARLKLAPGDILMVKLITVQVARTVAQSMSKILVVLQYIFGSICHHML